MSDLTPTARLEGHIVENSFDDLSPQAVLAVKTFVLDTLGVAMSGANAAFADEVREGLSKWSAGDEARVLGTDLRTTAGSAAMMNAFNAHCQEYDCVHEGAVVHPLATIQPATLAWCERESASRKVTGRELIEALATGVDISTTIGVSSNATLKFFRPATAGVFGTAAAIAKLSGLRGEPLSSAMGLALAQCSGTMQPHDEGLCTLAVQVGFGARSGLQAVDMAMTGVPGPKDWLEGPHGYLKLFEGDWTLEPRVDELDTVSRITEVSHKPFPSGRATHGGVDGLLQLRAIGVREENVEKIEIHVPPLIEKLVGRPVNDTMGVNYARLCLQYVGAIALIDGTIEVTDYAFDRIRNKRLQALAERIHIVVDDNPDPNALSPQRVVAHLVTGETREVVIANTLGSPANPLTRDQHLDKFRRNWKFAPASLSADRCERVIETVDHLEALDDVTRLIDLLVP